MGLRWGGMGRPPLALGTAGAIRYYKTATGYRARVLVRDYDGQVRSAWSPWWSLPRSRSGTSGATGVTRDGGDVRSCPPRRADR